LFIDKNGNTDNKFSVTSFRELFIRQMSGRQIGIFTLGLKYRGFYTKYGK